MDLTRLTECLLYQSQLPIREQRLSEGQLSERILVVGSGELESMLAIELAEQGKEVTIIETSDEILSDCIDLAKRVELMRKLEKLVVTIFLETSILNVSENQVCLCNREEFEWFLTIDNIIVSKNYEYSQNRL